jgi:ubiquinone/menaquinone biosynthesis C-methylase UbiE
MSTIFDAEQAAQIYDSPAATYNKIISYHRNDVRLFVQKAAMQEAECVPDLGSGTGRVAAEARRYTMGKIVGVDISTKMVTEARQHAKNQGLQIAYLVGDFTTMQRLAAIKPPRCFDAITCLWCNVTYLDGLLGSAGPHCV